MSYRDDERRVIDAYALSVLTNPDASPRDREAARRRLTEERFDHRLGLEKLSTSQLTELTNAGRTWSALMRVARGEPYVAPELAPKPFTPALIDVRSEPVNARTSEPAIASELTATVPIATPEPAPVIASELTTTAPRYTLAEIKRALACTPLMHR